MNTPICIVVSSAMTVNAFLLEPIKKLSKHYSVYLVVNGHAEEIAVELELAEVIPVRIERKVAVLHDLCALFRLLAIFRRYDFEVVQSVTPKAGLLAMLAAFLAGKKARIHIFTGQVWATRRGVKRWLLKQLDRLIAALATDVLVDSISQRQFLLNENVVAPTKSAVLAMGSISGVDLRRFRPNRQARREIRRDLGIQDDDYVYLFIGRLNPDKGVLDLADAFSRIANDKVHLIVVGPDEGGMRAAMTNVLAACVRRVHFLGFSAEPERYMAAADALCLPSYREGFGSVVLEAAAVGIPAIGSRIYGVEDAILDGRTGMLFEAGNRDELHSCLMQMAGDAEKSRVLGDNAKKRVMQEFDSKILATAWLEYYQSRF